MKKITLKMFETLIVNNSSSTNKVPSIKANNIKELEIGKSYFYKIKDNKSFLIEYKNQKISIYDILNAYFSKNIPLNNASVGFIKKHSYLDFFEPHTKNYHFIRLDIRSFFHSINIEEIKKVFKPYFHDTYIDTKKTQHILDAFLNLVTYELPKTSKNEKFRGKRILPMGFKTSPIISNIVFRQLDIQIQEFCSSKDIIYTRYADDMLFSSSKNLSYIHSESFINEIRIIISQLSEEKTIHNDNPQKLQLNEHKTIKAKHTLSLNGYTIQYSKFHSDSKTSKEEMIYELRLSNKKINIIKKMIYMINVEKKSENIILKKLFPYKVKFKFRPIDRETYEKIYMERLLNKVLGYRSYLLSILKFNDQHKCTQKDTIIKYRELIYSLDTISDKLQSKLEKLEKVIEQNRPFHKMAKVEIDSLGFTEGIKNKLKEEDFKTLKDFYEVNKEKLMMIKGIGEKKAESIIKVIDIELKKYKVG